VAPLEEPEDEVAVAAGAAEVGVVATTLAVVAVVAGASVAMVAGASVAVVAGASSAVVLGASAVVGAAAALDATELGLTVMNTPPGMEVAGGATTAAEVEAGAVEATEVGVDDPEPPPATIGPQSPLRSTNAVMLKLSTELPGLGNR
jgi:hypothetical protein